MNSELDSVSALRSFIDFAVNDNYACPYDKDLYRDLDSKGRIHDPADWFEATIRRSAILVEEEVRCKLGTLYALFRSLKKHNDKLYNEIVLDMKFPVTNSELDYVFLALACLREKCSNWDKFFKASEMLTIGGVQKIIRTYILSGRLCCSVEYAEVRSLAVEEVYRNFYIGARSWGF